MSICGTRNRGISFALGAAALLTAGCTSQGWTNYVSPGRFVTSLCVAGDTLWIGTEDQGLWRLDLAAGPDRSDSWRPFEVGYDPAPASIYGIAVDVRGRTWFGTADRGVAVYNGKEWRTYGVLDGCGGQRVFAIAADPDPARGDVWIATDAGLTRYTPGADGGAGSWQTYTRLHGLPSDQVTAVAVGAGGRVWAGTEADGLTWSDPPYSQWRSPALAVPGTKFDMVNALAVQGAAMAAGTTLGVAIRSASGGDLSAWQGLSAAPFENCARGLAWDGAGGLWIASRRKGLARLDTATGQVRTWQHAGAGAGKLPPDLPDSYVMAVAVGPDGAVWAGTYGRGLTRLAGAAVPPMRAPAPAPLARAQGKGGPAAPALPDPANPPTPDEIAAMLEEVLKSPATAAEQQPPVIRFDDDWLTRGDWLGRHGRYWACISGICSPGDYLWGAGSEKVAYHARIGPPARSGDSLRYWVHWLHTDNPNSLEMPPTYFHSRVLKGFQTWDLPRRQAEWCDNGHEYPVSAQGPNLYCTLRIPPGLFYLSLYFNNKDGHAGNNRFRDYRISVRRHPQGTAIWEIDGFDGWPELASGRVVDFWNGTYKRFLVRGPDEITVCVERNHSFNTVLMGVFLDLLDELPPPYYAAGEVNHRRAAADSTAPEARLLEALEGMPERNVAWWVLHGRPMYAALARLWRGRSSSEVVRTDEERAIYARLATCYCRLGLYSQWEAALTRAGIAPARQIEKALRWDGVRDFDGKGYQAVTEYLKSHPDAAKAPGARPGPRQD